MKKKFLVVLFVFFVPFVMFSFFDGIVKDAVRGVVKDAVKDAKNEAVKSMDEELKAVIEQEPVEMSPEAVLKAVKAALVKEFAIKKQDILLTDISYDEKNIDGNPEYYIVSLSVQAIQFAVLLTADNRSKTDMDSWQSDLKAQKQSADLVNTVYKNILDWSPYAAKPYIITVLAVKDGELKQDYYDRTLKALKTVFPEMIKPPSSLWLITE